jgi:hypothetical protein
MLNHGNLKKIPSREFFKTYKILLKEKKYEITIIFLKCNNNLYGFFLIHQKQNGKNI